MSGALLCLAAAGAHAQQAFPNVTRTPGELLTTGSQGFSSDGRGAIIAFHGGLLYTVPEHPSSAAGSSFEIKVWDISTEDRIAAPRLVENLGIGPMNMQAHGYVLYDGMLQLGSDDWSLLRTGFQQYQRVQWPDGLQNIAWERGRIVPGWVFGHHVDGAPTDSIGGNWFYNLEDRRFAIGRRAVPYLHGATELWASFDHLALSGGVMGMPLIFGDLLIIASEEVSLSGLAVYDLKPTWRQPGTPPTLLSVFRNGGTGGYWPELWGQGDRLYVFFPRRNDELRGWQIVDISQPDAPSLVTDVRLDDWRDGLMYVQFQDQHAFSGRFKIDMLNPATPVLTLPVEQPGFRADTSQFALPLGNLLVTGGLGDLQNQAWRIWAHQAEPDMTGPSVGYHRPRPNQTDWPRHAPLAFLIHETLRIETVVNGVGVILRPVGGAPIDALVNFTSGGQLNVVPTAPLAEDTEYEVVFPAGGIQDAAGNGMQGYSFRFSTGSTAGGNVAPTIDAFAATPYPAAPGAAVDFGAIASDPNSGGVLQYRFTFGDGQSREWSTQATAQHAYAAPGRYDALLQVRDAQGAIASRATRITVTSAFAGIRPTASSPLATSVDGGEVWSVNPDADTVSRFRLSDMQRLGEYAVGADPRSLTIDARGRVWVACHDDDRIDLLDAATGALQQSIDTGYGSAPAAVLLSPDGNEAWISLQGAGELLRVSVADLTQQRVAVGPDPRALAVGSDGRRVFATRFASPRNHGEVYEVDRDSMTLTRTIALPLRAIANESSADGRGVPNYLTAIAIEPNGTRAWVAAKKDNITRGLQFYDGRHELDPDNTVRAQVIPIDLATNRQDATRVRDLDNSDSPSALAFSEHGDYLFVTLQGNNQVAIVDTLQLASDPAQQGLGGRIATGHAPQGVLATGGASPRLVVQNFLDRSVQAHPLSTFLASGTGIGLPSTGAAVATEPLDATVLRGKRLFYNAADTRMSGEGYISCATCHLDGGSDGRVWDFTGRGEGLRNNIDLRGRGGTAHGFVHWTANFDEIQDFENDIRNFFGGLGFMGEADFAATADPLGAAKAGRSVELDDLAAYVTSLDARTIPRSPFRTPDGAMTASAQRGAVLFATLGCASCHVPQSGYRDGMRHDVGTLRPTSGQRIGAELDGIDTPTLLGLWANPPYLHDGSADMLADVFRSSAGLRVQTESGAVSGGASIESQYIDLNAANASHGGFVNLQLPGHGLRIDNVDGGSGGASRLEFRIALDRDFGDFALQLRVNGAARTLTIPARGSAVGWHTLAVDDVELLAGANNMIELEAQSGGYPPLRIDELTVARPADLQRAEPHRRVLARSAGEQADLAAFLLQLDGQDAPGAPIDPVFADGFEVR